MGPVGGGVRGENATREQRPSQVEGGEAASAPLLKCGFCGFMFTKVGGKMLESSTIHVFLLGGAQSNKGSQIYAHQLAGSWKSMFVSKTQGRGTMKLSSVMITGTLVLYPQALKSGFIHLNCDADIRFCPSTWRVTFSLVQRDAKRTPHDFGGPNPLSQAT